MRELSDNFLGKNYSIFFVHWLNFFSSPEPKLCNFLFCEICGYKKGIKTNFPPSFVVVRSGIDKNQDPGSGINTGILDPQHRYIL